MPTFSHWSSNNKPPHKRLRWKRHGPRSLPLRRLRLRPRPRLKHLCSPPLMPVPPPVVLMEAAVRTVAVEVVTFRRAHLLPPRVARQVPCRPPRVKSVSRTSGEERVLLVASTALG